MKYSHMTSFLDFKDELQVSLVERWRGGGRAGGQDGGRTRRDGTDDMIQDC